MIVSANKNGLSNRIKSWASSMYLSGDSEVLVDWPVNRTAGASFHDLFENDVSARYRPIDSNDKCYRLWSLVTDKGDDPIDFAYHNTPLKYIVKYKKIFGNMKPNQELIDKAQDYPRNMTAILARTWPDCEMRSFIGIEKLYIEQMHSLDGNFFVSSDSPYFIDLARKEFGDRIITQYDRGPFGARNRKGIIDSFVDMLIASRQPIIIGDSLSTFNEVAWWFGDCKPLVHLVNEPDLDQLGINFRTDKSSIRVKHPKKDRSLCAHNYFNLVYKKLFEPLRTKRIKLVEIGVQHGSSVRTWASYFLHGQIYGIDYSKASMTDSIPRVKTLLGNQADKSFLNKFGKEHGPFDIIIDDGSHWYEHQLISLFALWDYLKPGGYYFIEDIFPKDNLGGEPLWNTYIERAIRKVLFGGNKFAAGQKYDYESINFVRNMLYVKKKAIKSTPVHQFHVPLF